jgi:thiamine-monophosphate kinase
MWPELGCAPTLNSCYNFAMKVSELGEFALIGLLAKMAGGGDKRLLVGIGDDAAAWRSDGSIQLATVDSFIQGVHFPPGLASWKELGWKALAVNLSDIAAMGGLPRYALVSLALPENTEVDDVTTLYTGMLDLAKQFGVSIIGGDVSRAPLVAITIAVFGGSQKRGILKRSTARAGELIAVTGELGAAAGGLEMLTKGLKFDPQVSASFRNAFLHPLPRIAEGRLLVGQGVKTAIDLSDGLVSDLNQICRASQVGARIEIEQVPVAPVLKVGFADRALEMALGGGEDYELLFTAKAAVMERVKRKAACPITVIGEILAGDKGVTLVDSQGKPVNLVRRGWEHFITR